MRDDRNCGMRDKNTLAAAGFVILKGRMRDTEKGGIRINNLSVAKKQWLDAGLKKPGPSTMIM